MPRIAPGELLARIPEEFRAPLADKRFYHVAPSALRDRISREGIRLVPDVFPQDLALLLRTVAERVRETARYPVLSVYQSPYLERYVFGDEERGEAYVSANAPLPDCYPLPERLRIGVRTLAEAVRDGHATDIEARTVRARVQDLVRQYDGSVDVWAVRGDDPSIVATYQHFLPGNDPSAIAMEIIGETDPNVAIRHPIAPTSLTLVRTVANPDAWSYVLRAIGETA